MQSTEKKKEVNGFMRGLLWGTITQEKNFPVNGELPDADLRQWVQKAVEEKISRDVTKVIPESQLSGTPASREALRSAGFEDHIVFFLDSRKTAVLVRTAPKSTIGMLWATEDEGADGILCTDLARSAQALGLEVVYTAFLYVPYDSNWTKDMWTGISGPPGAEREEVRKYVEAIGHAVVTRKSARDAQRMPGPSDLADLCDLCVAKKIARFHGTPMGDDDRDFSLKAWVGTACHEKTERDLPRIYPYAEQEISVEIARIRGIGTVTGHIDLYLPRRKGLGDWKTTDLAKLDTYMRSGVPEYHAGQTMLYMYGLKASGRDVEYASLAYIPRDSNSTSDLWVASCSYRKDIAESLLKRAENLAGLVGSGSTGNLQPHPTCFPCNRWSRPHR